MHFFFWILTIFVECGIFYCFFYINRDNGKFVVTLYDFDDVTYHITNVDDPNFIVISMHIKGFSELAKYGVKEILQREYGNAVTTPAPGNDVAIRLDVSQAPKDDFDAIEAYIQSIYPTIEKFALLKRNVLAAPFEAAFSAQTQGQETSLMAIPYRQEESFYVQAQKDRVTVIFSIAFKEETDQIFGKTFLQEFVDARKQTSTQNAPQVLFSHKEPPRELSTLSLKPADNISYVTFVLFPRHFQGKNAVDVISKIQLFRTYLHYHIKTSKAYMHSRMRSKVDSLLKVLNRAKPEKPDFLKEKKTASGRTFVHS